MKPEAPGGELETLIERLLGLIGERAGALAAVAAFIGADGRVREPEWPGAGARPRGWWVRADITRGQERLGAIELCLPPGAPPPSDQDLELMEVCAGLLALFLSRRQPGAAVKGRPDLALVR